MSICSMHSYIFCHSTFIYSVALSQSKRDMRGRKEEGENLERKKINCLRKIKIGTFSFPKKLKNWFCIWSVFSSFIYKLFVNEWKTYLNWFAFNNIALLFSLLVFFSSQFKTWGWEIVLAPSLLSPYTIFTLCIWNILFLVFINKWK